MTQPSQNRRQFTRIPFRTLARLEAGQEDFDAQVLDISLKGVLLKTAGGVFVTVGAPCTVRIRLDELGTLITMACTVVHREHGYYGLACREIDLDSITHLRRLVELNLGDEELLSREVAALYDGSY